MQRELRARVIAEEPAAVVRSLLAVQQARVLPVDCRVDAVRVDGLHDPVIASVQRDSNRTDVLRPKVAARKDVRNRPLRLIVEAMSERELAALSRNYGSVSIQNVDGELSVVVQVVVAGVQQKLDAVEGGNVNGAAPCVASAELAVERVDVEKGVELSIRIRLAQKRDAGCSIGKVLASSSRAADVHRHRILPVVSHASTRR